MKARVQTFVIGSALAVALILTTGNSAYAQTCQPGISTAIAGPHSAQYIALATALGPAVPTLTTQLAAVVDQATYQTLLTTANALAGTVATGRVLITLPDGTVVLDTNRADNTADPTSNSYQHFLDKTINENHNSRIAILAAQEYPCGVGIESKLSSSTGQNEAYIAIRAGTHLDSVGTLRMSSRQ